MPSGIVATILVIDDDASVRRFIRIVLESAGHTVHEAEDGSTGLEAFDRLPVDLTIVDLFLPGEDGLDIIRELHHRDRAATIVAISGGLPDTWASMQQAEHLGAARVLAKPFRPEELSEAVGALLGDPA